MWLKANVVAVHELVHRAIAQHGHAQVPAGWQRRGREVRLKRTSRRCHRPESPLVQKVALRCEAQDGAVVCLVGERLCSGLDADWRGGAFGGLLRAASNTSPGRALPGGRGGDHPWPPTTMSFSPETLSVVCQDALDKLQKIRKEV